MLAIICLRIILVVASVSSVLPNSVELEIIKEFVPVECESIAENGDVVSVHYTGRLESGIIFDSSRTAGRDPIEFMLGEKRVIKGWEEGIKGMCLGEKRKLIIPPHLGYGSQGSGSIPPNSVLVFETELVSLKKHTTEVELIKIIKFLAVPVGVLLFLYYLYKKMKTDFPSQKKRNKKIKKSKF